MVKKIDSQLAEILKAIINDELKHFKNICVDNFFNLSTITFYVELTIFYDNWISFLLKETIEKEGNVFHITYISRISIERDISYEDKYIFRSFPHAVIVKDENRFLVNMKSMAIFFKEKHASLIHKVDSDRLRWVASNYIAAISFHDSQYLRFKIYETLVGLYNYFSTNDHISESSLPFLFQNPKQHSFISQIVKDELESEDFQQEMIRKMDDFGGLLKSISSEASFFSDEVVVVFRYNELDLDTFLEDIFLKFFTLTKSVNHKLKRFYWEKNKQGQFTLYLNADQVIIRNEILPELILKCSSHIHLKQVTDLSTIYDFFQEYYFEPLYKLSEYILHLKTDEDVLWDEKVAIVYSIELYISYFIRSGFSKHEFYEFNKFLSQKWQLFILSDEELMSNEYFSINECYQKFEKLYVINESSLMSNFVAKLDQWVTEDPFADEICEINKQLTLFLNDKKIRAISDAIVADFSESSKYAFLEGLFFKFFGLMGLSIQSKVYITYIINRLGNES